MNITAWITIYSDVNYFYGCLLIRDLTFQLLLLSFFVVVSDACVVVFKCVNRKLETLGLPFLSGATILGSLLFTLQRS